MIINSLLENLLNVSIEYILRCVISIGVALPGFKVLTYSYNDQGWLTTMNQASLGGTNIAFPTCTTSVVNPGVTTTGQADDTKDLFTCSRALQCSHRTIYGR